jgi:nucleoside-diphosphate-sugar epimerase
MKRILVTGAKGLVGSTLQKMLLKNKLEVFTTDLIGDVDFRGDLKDGDFVKSLPKVDCIINCAAVQYLSPNIPFFKRKEFFYDNNVLSVRNLNKKYGNSIKFFIQFGSSMMYRKNFDGKYDVKSGFTGNGIYSDSKCKAYEESKKLKCPLALIIPSIIAGSGRKGFFSLIATMINNFRIVIMPGACNHLTGVIHVDDVCSLVMKILATRAEGIFNADSGENSSINEWVDLISKEMNKKVLKVKIPLMWFKLIGFLSSYRLIAKEQLMILEYPQCLELVESEAIGWEPSKNIKKILKDTISK